MSKIWPSFGDLMVPYPIFKINYQIIIDLKEAAGNGPRTSVRRLSQKKIDNLIIGEISVSRQAAKKVNNDKLKKLNEGLR